MESFGVEPKMIDYGDDNINIKSRGIDDEEKMFSNVVDRNKKKKTEE